MKWSERFATFILINIAMGVGAIFGGLLAKSETLEQCRREAVDAGHARYKAVDKYGSFEWEWLPPCCGEKKAP